MRDQLKQVLMACVAVLALLLLFADRSFGYGLIYILFPTLPLLAGLLAMHWVKGMPFIWWYRLALPWTLASMLVILLVRTDAKPMVATFTGFVFSIATLALIFSEFIMPHYRIARSTE